MTEFSTWASRRHIKNVEVVLYKEDGKTERAKYDMKRDRNNDWKVNLPQEGPGALYKFRFNRDPAQTWPDPRSQFQPFNQHGPSMIVDHKFDWKNDNFRPAPLDQAVLYELHVGTFTPEGTFESAIERLPEVKALGATHLNVLPVVECGGTRNWGYDGVDMFAVYGAYGKPQQFKQFVDAAHKQGLGIILDVVYNHFGPDGNYTGLYAPYQNKLKTPWGGAINFDESGSKQVRQFVKDNVTMWLLDYHVDGLRIDAADHLHDRKTPKHIIAEISDTISLLSRKTGRDYVKMAEYDSNDPAIITSTEEGGYGMDVQYVDNIHHALRTRLTGDKRGYFQDFGSMEDLQKGLTHGPIQEGQFSKYRNRLHGKPYGDRPYNRFLAFSSNHDQVGNRAKGDRLAHVVGTDKAMIAATLTLMAPMIPMLYQGDEWASSSPFQFFCDHQDLNIAKATTDGRKKDIAKLYDMPVDDVPDPQALDTFMRSKLKWEERDQPEHAPMLEWHKNLLALRKAVPNFGTTDRAVATGSEAEDWLKLKHSGMTTIVNMSGKPRRVPFGTNEGQILLTSKQGYTQDGDHLVMPAQSAIVAVNSELVLVVVKAAPSLIRSNFAPPLNVASIGTKRQAIAGATLES